MAISRVQVKLDSATKNLAQDQALRLSYASLAAFLKVVAASFGKRPSAETATETVITEARRNRCRRPSNSATGPLFSGRKWPPKILNYTA